MTLLDAACPATRRLAAAPLPTSDVVQLSASALSRAIHAREVSCVEVMQAYLAHIAQHNPRTNAIVNLCNAGDLLAQARTKDQQLAQGHDHGWLHGIPQAPKDLGPVRGLRSTKGSPIYQDTVAQTDSIVFARMRAAGAIFIGRTNVPEFGLGAHTFNPVFGPTHNALQHGLSAGGSSGGAAAALALHMLPVADGSDQMGSLRIPAAFNQVLGFRPTYGVVPFGPATDGYLQQFSTEGPMARNVPDLLALLQVQAGYDARSPLSLTLPQLQAAQPAALQRNFTGVRVAWLGDYGGYLPMAPGLLAHCEGALEHLRAVGCEVVPVAVDFPLEALWSAWTTLRSYGVAATNAALYRDPATRALLKPEMVWEIEQGLALSAMDIARASEVRTRWLHAVHALLAQYEFAVLPSAQVYPFEVQLRWPDHIGARPMDTYHRWMEVVIGATMAGLPALSVPAGLNAAGQPAGLQILGACRSDLQVLQLGHAYEQARLAA